MVTVAELEAMPVRRRVSCACVEKGFTVEGLKASCGPRSSNPTIPHSPLQGVSPPPPETRGFGFQQTMLRVKDPAASLDFYTRVLGMRLLLHLPFPDRAFSLYFLGYASEADVAALPADPAGRAAAVFALPGLLELTHNFGTEAEPGPVYKSGNEADCKGFGHIGISVPSVEAACARFAELGVPFKKKPGEGSMKDIAFIADPDGYWVEVIEPAKMRQFAT